MNKHVQSKSLHKTARIRWYWVLIALVILLLCATWPRLAASALLNWAQLSRLHDKELTPVFVQAHYLAPGDRHIRWQVGEALARVGENKSATEVLMPLATSEALGYFGLRTLIESLVQVGETRRAWELLCSSEGILPIDPRAAARLWLDALEGDSTANGACKNQLIAQTIGHPSSSNEFQLLDEKLSHPNFWHEPEGQNLLRWLRYMSKACCSRAYLQSHQTSNDTAIAVVSEILGMPEESVVLGPELATNGTFKVATHGFLPDGWFPSHMTTGDPWNRALFVLSVDRGAARIDGIIVEHLPSLEPARAGFWHPVIPVRAQTPYLISFQYCTQDMPEDTRGSTFYLADDARVITGTDYALSSTDGEWKQVVVVGWNSRPDDTVIRPLLRSFSTGTVWFDNLSVREVRTDASPSLREPVVVVKSLSLRC